MLQRLLQAGFCNFCEDFRENYPEIKKVLDFSYGHYNFGLKAPGAQVVFLKLRRPGLRDLNIFQNSTTGPIMVS